MCLAIYRPAGVKLENYIYENAFENNDDGAGFAYVGTRKDGSKGVVIEKGFMTIKRLLEALKPHEGKEMLIHFRRVSVGEVSKDNCHPFGFGSSFQPQLSFAVMHNGTLPYPGNGKKSDTHSFVEEVLAPHMDRDPYFLQYEPGPWMMERIIGANNKIVMMRYDAKKDETQVYILNKDKGTEVFGCWMSNTSYLKKVVYTPPVHHHGGYYGDDFYGHGPSNKAVDTLSNKDYDLRDWYLDKSSTPAMWRRKPPPEVTPTTACGSGGEVDRDKVMAENSIIARVVIEEGGSFEPDLEPDAVTVNAQLALAEGEGFVLPVEQPTKPIEVPRDADAKPSPGADCSHLSRKQIGKMRTICNEYIAAIDLPNSSAMTFIEKVNWVRDDLRKGVDECEKMTDAAIDCWLLTKVYTLENRIRSQEQDNQKKLRLAQQTN